MSKMLLINLLPLAYHTVSIALKGYSSVEVT